MADLLRKTEERVIGDDTLEVTQLGAIKGRAVFVRVLKVIGPALTGKDMAGIFAGLNEEDVTYLCDAFAPMTLVKGKGQLDKIFDVYFAGRFLEMFQWLAFCIELNFASFFKGGSALLGAAAVPGAAKGVSK